MAGKFPDQIRGCDGAVLSLDADKEYYFSEYIARRFCKAYTSNKPNVYKRDYGVSVAPCNDLSCCRYLVGKNNRVNFYAFEECGRLYVKNVGNKAIFATYNGIETVILPGKTEEIKEAIKRGKSNDTE